MNAQRTQTEITARRKIRSVMKLRGITSKALATAIGFKSRAHMDNVISGCNPSPAARRKIEAYFGQSFWSLPGEFSQAVTAHLPNSTQDASGELEGAVTPFSNEGRMKPVCKEQIEPVACADSAGEKLVFKN